MMKSLRPDAIRLLRNFYGKGKLQFFLEISIYEDNEYVYQGKFETLEEAYSDCPGLMDFALNIQYTAEWIKDDFNKEYLTTADTKEQCFRNIIEDFQY